MRLLPRIVIVGCAAVLMSGAGVAQRTDDKIAPESVALAEQGKAALAAGKLSEAEGLFETALAIDPRNRWAYVDIARVAERQRLFGKAIRMTNRALALNPNDPDAIAVQGEAMVQLGAVARAQANLQKLQQVCKAPCPQASQLQAAISRGPTIAEAKTGPTPKKN